MTWGRLDRAWVLRSRCSSRIPVTAGRTMGNTIGDAGLIAFADACTQNALPSLRVLWLQNNFGGQVFTNEFGVAGIEGLTAALTLGALPLLEELELVFTAGGAREALSAACAARGIRYT